MEDLVTPGWQDRRVFVTGHTGFKGGWLCLWLSALKAHVCGYALDPPTEPNLFTALQLGDLIEDHRGDIRDAQTLVRRMRDFEPEVVFHLAAQPLVRESYVDPVGTYMTNVIGTANVLEAVRQTPSVRAVVVVTTDKCYRNNEWVWGYREVDHLGGHDPYSSSKACALEILSASYRSSYFHEATEERHVALATARAGQRHRRRRLVSRPADSGLDSRLRRKGADAYSISRRRPPVATCARAFGRYLLLASKLLAGESGFDEAWNFGPSEEGSLTVAQIATAMAEKWGSSATWTTDPRPSGMKLTCFAWTPQRRGHSCRGSRD